MKISFPLKTLTKTRPPKIYPLFPRTAHECAARGCGGTPPCKQRSEQRQTWGNCTSHILCSVRATNSFFEKKMHPSALKCPPPEQNEGHINLAWNIKILTIKLKTISSLLPLLHTKDPTNTLRIYLWPQSLKLTKQLHWCFKSNQRSP